eukprot:gene5274-28010_t
MAVYEFLFYSAVVASQQHRVDIDVSTPTHRVNPMFMGCHSDSGFAHTERGFYSQLIYGESFEFGNASSWDYVFPEWDKLPTAGTPGGLKWNLLMPDDTDADVSFDTTKPHHGYASLKIDYTTTTGNASLAGATNRGMGNEGLTFTAGMPYEGYLFAKASAGTRLTVALRDYTGAKNEWLAQQTLVVPVLSSASSASSASDGIDSEWVRLNFTLTPSASTTCEGIKDGSDPNVQCQYNNSHPMAGPPNNEQGHICIRCGGEFVVGLETPGTVNIDYVFLQPGAWGRWGDGPFLKSGVQVLKDMGITAIRLGGSFTDPSYYFWKKWTGVPWERASLGAKWGSELISGFGPFEFIDMCAEAGIEPILTTTAQWGDFMNRAGPDTCCSPSDMADLVDYTWGDASTEWGAKRIAEGHPDPYKVKYIELGNEQYNTLYPAQVKAMEERATKLGKPKFFYYLSPNNAKWLNSSQAAEVEALGLGDHVVSDEHVGAGGGVEKADELFNTQFPAMSMGAANAETNDGTHTLLRAIKEAADLNDWFSCSAPWCSRLKFRTASFCNERSGHFDMFTDTWQPNGLNVTVTGAGGHSNACEYYAFFSDHGCRTWGKQPGKAPLVTLHNRTGNGNEFPVVGTGVYCSNDPIFQDGPHNTPTDDACKAKCISGGSGSSSITASAQQSADGKQTVIRLTNIGTTSTTVTVHLGKGKGSSNGVGIDGKAGSGFEFSAFGGRVDMWTLQSESCDQLAANTPSDPSKVSPVHAVVAFDGEVTLPCSSVVVLRLNSTAAKHATTNV